MSNAISYEDFKVNIEFLYKNRKYEELVAIVDRFKNTSFFEPKEVKKIILLGSCDTW